MSKMLKSKKIYWLVLFCIFALFFVRIVNIDQDIAPWGVSMYQPADEGPYAYLAINEKTYGSIRPTIIENNQQIPLLISNNFITNIIGNALNILGFKVFGNNYYALRIPYVLLGFINLLLFWIILQKLGNQYGKDKSITKWAGIALLLWMTIDFTFFNASRIVEPTSVRLIFVQLSAIVFISKPENHTTRFLWLGIIITFSCFLVYITNVFLYLAVAITMLVRLPETKGKVFWKEVMWFVIGTLIMFFIAEAYYKIVWGKEAIQNAISTVLDFSKNSSAELTVNSEHSIPYTLALLYARIISSNPFFYNLPFLFAAFVVTVPLIRKIGRNKDQVLCFLLMIVFSFLLQTLVSADTITRKMIVVFPILVSLIYVVFISGESLRIVDNSSESNQKKKLYTFKKIGEVSIWLFALLSVLFAAVYRTKMYYWTADDFDNTSILLVFVLQAIPVMIIAIVGILTICKKNSQTLMTQTIRNSCVALCLCLVCVCNIAYCYKYYWKDPQYTEKQAMVDLAEQVDDKYVLGGGFQLGFTLYNNMKPIVNVGEEEMKASEILDDAVHFDYDNSNNELISYFNEHFYSKSNGNQFFVPIYDIKRGFKTFGYSRDFYLYKITDAQEYQAYLNSKMQESLRVIKEKYNAFENKEIEEVNIEKEKAWLYPLHPGFAMTDIDSSHPLVANVCGIIKGNTEQAIFGDVLRSIYGDVNQPIFGNVYGDIYGDINAQIIGTVYGTIYGKINTPISGGIVSGKDKLLLDVSKEDAYRRDIAEKSLSSNYLYCIGPISGMSLCSIIGDTVFPIYNDLENIYGNVCEDIYGDVYGNIYGDVKADIHGRVYGTIYGTVDGNIIK